MAVQINRHKDEYVKMLKYNIYRVQWEKDRHSNALILCCGNMREYLSGKNIYMRINIYDIHMYVYLYERMYWLGSIGKFI